MPILSAVGLGKHYGTRVLFQDVDFAIEEGARVGLIGANGTGKSTILRILLGDDDHDGTVARKKDLRIASLEQDPTFPEGATVKEALLASDPELLDLERRMREIHDKLAEGGDSERLLPRLAELESRFEHRGGYTLEHRADRVLDGVGFPAARHDEKVASLSGGERNRVAFARTLLSEPDVWLLDEPTNHLDLDGILFLEETLRESRTAAVIVSHDRRFLDRTTTETWELEGGRLWKYPAPYSRAKELRAERLKAASRAYESQQAEIAKQEEFIRRYQAGQRARQATGRKKLLDRVVRLDRPEDCARVMNLDLPQGESLGVRALQAKELSVAFGERTIFRDLSLEILGGETFGIVGPNGAGKTSLLRILLGELPGAVKWHPKAKIGVLRQQETFPDETLTPFTFLRSIERRRSDLALRNALAAMLFKGDDVDKPVSVLSGGERKRLILAQLLFEGNNVLILDEPTNHLDLPSREALEIALATFEGTILVVSHDRYFLDQVADRVLWLEGGQAEITNGGFEEALARRRRRAAPSEPKAAAAPPPPPPPESPRAKKAKSPFSRLRTEELEERIIAGEDKVKTLETEFASPEVYRNAARLKEVREEIDRIKRELAELEAEYGSRSR